MLMETNAALLQKTSWVRCKLTCSLVIKVVAVLQHGEQLLVGTATQCYYYMQDGPAAIPYWRSGHQGSGCPEAFSGSAGECRNAVLLQNA